MNIRMFDSRDVLILNISYLSVEELTELTNFLDEKFGHRVEVYGLLKS